MDRRKFLGLLSASAGAALVNTTAWAADTTATASAKKPGHSHTFLPIIPGKNGKLLISHRGASSYAPENTLPAYELAIKQGADLVEQDLHITKDGVLICMHDDSLEATTNVEDVFTDRFKHKTVSGKQVKTWPISDFTLAEIKKLKANSREGKFADTTVPTWQEAIELIGDRAGLCPEIKGPETYAKLGFNMEKLVAEVLRKNGLDKAKAGSKTPVLMQSFSQKGLLNLRKLKIEQPMLWLRSSRDKDPMAAIAVAKKFGFESLGPFKASVTKDYVDQCHALGIKVIPYTYYPDVLPKQFPNLKAEMSYDLYEKGIDGLFTNNPDLFPRHKI